jgi:hypothetical protein
MSDERHLLELKIDPGMEKHLHISTLILAHLAAQKRKKSHEI